MTHGNKLLLIPMLLLLALPLAQAQATTSYCSGTTLYGETITNVSITNSSGIVSWELFNFSTTENCPYNCNNVTFSCNPPPSQGGLPGEVYALFELMALAFFFYGFARRSPIALLVAIPLFVVMAAASFGVIGIFTGTPFNNWAGFAINTALAFFAFGLAMLFLVGKSMNALTGGRETITGDANEEEEGL